MALARWFESQLLSTAEAFVWTVEQITPERKIAAPPAGLGQWSAARHAFHLVYYEQKIALPSMRQWLDGPRPSRQGLNEQAAWGNSQDLENLLMTFRRLRYEQAVVLTQFDSSAWEERKDTIWHRVSLEWVVTKSLQHTADHLNEVMKLLLFWDVALQRTEGDAG